MRRLMIAADYDGTVSFEGKVREEDKEAIRRFRRAGHLFGLVTGRLTKTALDAAATVEHDFTIASSGGVILDANDEILFAEAVKDRSCLPSLFAAARDNGSVNFLVGASRICYAFDIHADAFDQSVIPPHEDIHEVCFYISDHTRVESCLRALAPIAEGVYAIHVNGGSIDMPAYGVSKETGIVRLAEMFAIAHDDIYCVGDQRNDLPMIRAFHGFAVSNAVSVLKEAAEFQCDRIADMIDRVLAES